MRYSYTVAKFVIGLLEILGWAVFCLGLIGGVFYFQVYGALALVVGLAISASGLLEIVAGQMAMAQIATAENTRAMLELMQRDKGRDLAKTRIEPPMSLNGPVR